MKKSLCVVSLLMLASLSLAQVDTLWTRTVGADGYLEFTDAVYLPGDSFAVVGKYTPLDTATSQIYMTIADIEGNLGEPILFTSSQGIYARAIERAGDGTLVIMGYDYAVGGFNPDLMLKGVSVDGSELWTTYFDNIYYYEPYDITALPDGNLAFCAALPGDQDLDRDVWVVKMDSDGDTLWSNRFDFEFSDKPSAITAAEDGSIFVAVAAADEGFTSTTIWVLKLDDTGSEIWRQFVEIEQNAYVGGMELGTDGSLFLAGEADSISVPTRPVAARLNSLGEVDWYTRETTSGAVAGFTGILPRADNGANGIGYGYSVSTTVARAVSLTSAGDVFDDWLYGNVASRFESVALAPQFRGLACGYVLPITGNRRGFLVLFSPTTILNGRVLQVGNNTPIENAIVTVVETGDTGVSDADGFYTLYTNVEVSDVTVSGPCISPVTEEAYEFSQGAPNTLNFSVGTPGFASNPSSVNTSVEYDVPDATTITISNNGSGELLYTSSVETTAPDYNWLSVDPPSGSVPLSGSLQVSVIVHPQSAQGSDLEFFGSVTLHTNACPESTVVIPVSALALNGEEHPELVREFAMHPVYPNPFNASAELQFEVPYDAPVSIMLYNLTGQVVATLADQTYPAGSHSLSFSLPNAPSGIYYLRMTAGTFSAVQKAVLLK